MQLLTAQPILDTVSWDTFAALPTKTLAIILVGNDPASELYVSIKERKAAQYNVKVMIHRLAATSTTDDVIACVQRLNNDVSIDALIVQLPLPESIDTQAVLATLAPHKDVDNLSGKNTYLSPMVQAVMAMKEQYGLDFGHKTIAVVGQGAVVGLPLATHLEESGYVVTRIDIDTPHADEMISKSDIVFGATGSKYRINESNTREGQIVFDCSGVDVDIDAIAEKAAAVTPPKGGLGPLTVHFLFTNVRIEMRKPGEPG